MRQHSAKRHIAFFVGTAVLIAGCSTLRLDQPGARPVAVQAVAAGPDLVWEGVTTAVQKLGLVVSDVRPEERVLQLTWITAPGDGRQYLRCHDGGRIGSASLQPRIVVRPTVGGSTIEIASVGRATVGSGCVSTGQYEQWLLGQMAPTVAAAALAP